MCEKKKKKKTELLSNKRQKYCCFLLIFLHHFIRFLFLYIILRNCFFFHGSVQYSNCVMCVYMNDNNYVSSFPESVFESLQLLFVSSLSYGSRSSRSSSMQSSFVSHSLDAEFLTQQSSSVSGTTTPSFSDLKKHK